MTNFYLFHLTEYKPNFKLSSFHFGISVPVHNDTGEFHHSCMDAQMTSLQLIPRGITWKWLKQVRGY